MYLYLLNHSYGIHVPYLREKGPTMKYRPTPDLGLNFLLRSKVYSNNIMRPYVAALEHACAITIKWAWLRSLAVHDRSLRLKCGIRWTRLSSTAVWQIIFWSYLDYLKCSPHKPAVWDTVAVNSTMEYRPDKSRPRLVSNRTWAKSIVAATTIQTSDTLKCRSFLAQLGARMCNLQPCDNGKFPNSLSVW